MCGILRSSLRRWRWLRGSRNGKEAGDMQHCSKILANYSTMELGFGNKRKKLYRLLNEAAHVGAINWTDGSTTRYLAQPLGQFKERNWIDQWSPVWRSVLKSALWRKVLYKQSTTEAWNYFSLVFGSYRPKIQTSTLMQGRTPQSWPDGTVPGDARPQLPEVLIQGFEKR